MSPTRYLDNQDKFSHFKYELNKILSFEGLCVGEDGKLQRTKKATTINEAEARASKLREILLSRKVHPDILKYCKAELLVDNYFHAVFEATKSVAEKIRLKTGLTSDGSNLVDEAFSFKNNVPYLGLCFGMQMAVIEFARNVLGFKNANSQEVNSRTRYPVIHIMPNQEKYLEQKQYGGTIRLGAWPCKIKKGTLLEYSYKKFGKNKKSLWKLDRENKRIPKEKNNLIYERHRHRYEFNIKYRKKFEKAGLKISGISPDGKLVEAIELVNHPFFIGTQYHPEYISHPLNPHPIFCAFLEKSLERKIKKDKR